MKNQITKTILQAGSFCALLMWQGLHVALAAADDSLVGTETENHFKVTSAFSNPDARPIILAEEEIRRRRDVRRPGRETEAEEEPATEDAQTTEQSTEQTTPAAQDTKPQTATTPAPVTPTPVPSEAPVQTTEPAPQPSPAQPQQPAQPPAATTTVPPKPVATRPVKKPAAVSKGLPEPDLDKLDTLPAVQSRWDIVNTLGYPENLWDPYNANNPLKADKPVFGKDWFFNLGIESETLIRQHYIPLPVGVATAEGAGSLDLLGDGSQDVYNQNLVIELELYKGDTVFRPPDYEFRFTPVINFNRVSGEEVGILNVDPSVGEDGGTDRSDDFVGIQELFVDVHLRDVSPRYDFDSIRVGVQPFTADFRGFLYIEEPFGIRLFGTRDNNIFQYNMAWFRRIEKDTNSGLNDLGEDLRDDDVLVFNLYWQDFFLKGLITQFLILHNRNAEKGQLKYDENGFIARPSSLFEERFAHDYNVTYLGWSNDGHIGRLNLSSSLYYAFGDETSQFADGEENDVSAWFAAAEASYDIDWIRLRVSALYASGDEDPFDDTSQGFDAIFEQPLFAGGPSSYHISNSIPLIGGGGVFLSGRNGMLNSLRSSLEQGQSNFTNPGIRLLGFGGDFEILPELRASFNINQLWFDDTAVLEVARQQAGIDNDIGLDISLSAEYRPFMSQNIVAEFSYSVLQPGDGFKSLYGDDETYDAFTAVLILKY